MGNDYYESDERQREKWHHTTMQSLVSTANRLEGEKAALIRENESLKAKLRFMRQALKQG